MSEFIKILDYSSVLDSGEPAFLPVSPGIHNDHLIKTASGLSFTPKIRDYITSIKPSADKVYALVNAMGAGEFFGCNRNGDYFPEEALKVFHPTFVTDGKPFMYHQNKDPNKCYGNVLFSDYNDFMHRVELVIEYDTAKLERKWADKIRNGDLVTVSMGCRVPWDICSICGHKAKSPDVYCKHLKSSPGLGRMLEDGRRAFAINTEPTFFDISIVTIPADPTARVLIKIAAEKSSERRYYFFKSASARAEEEGFSAEKTADAVVQTINTQGFDKNENNNSSYSELEKAFDVIFKEFHSSLGDIPKELLNRVGEVSKDPLATLKGFIENKVMLKPNEVQRIVLVSSGKQDLADALDSKKVYMENDPSYMLDKLMGAISDTTPMQGLGQECCACRSLEPENIKRIVIKIASAPYIKQGSLVTVPESDSFRALSGEKEIAEVLPTFLSNPGAAIKTFLALGSIITAFNTMLGREITPSLLGGSAIASLVTGPILANGLSDLDDKINAPSQQMIFKNDKDPAVVEAAIRSALGLAQLRGAGIRTAGIEEFPRLGLKSLMAIPIAYGASKIIANKAKESAMENAAMTGKYEPGFLSKQEYTFPISLAMVLKYASAKNRLGEYIKTAEERLKQPISRLYSSNKEEFDRAFSNVLFKR